MKVFLVGMPGSGKSTLGAQVAQALNIPFIDLTKKIKRVQEAISSFFRAGSHFRKVESNIATPVRTQQVCYGHRGRHACYHDGITL